MIYSAGPLRARSNSTFASASSKRHAARRCSSFGLPKLVDPVGLDAAAMSTDAFNCATRAALRRAVRSAAARAATSAASCASFSLRSSLRSRPAFRLHARAIRGGFCNATCREPEHCDRAPRGCTFIDHDLRNGHQHESCKTGSHRRQKPALKKLQQGLNSA